MVLRSVVENHPTSTKIGFRAAASFRRAAGLLGGGPNTKRGQPGGDGEADLYTVLVRYLDGGNRMRFAGELRGRVVVGLVRTLGQEVSKPDARRRAGPGDRPAEKAGPRGRSHRR